MRNLPNLYLVGFMGTGKSVIGRRVAEILDLRFVDSDDQIEKRAGKSIKRIFNEDGEAAFREMERVWVEQGHASHGQVVACGGGLPVAPGMMDALKRRGITVCLFASVESILERVRHSKKRPLLNVEDPESRVRQLLAEREPIYLQADFSITTDGRPQSEVVAHILRLYRRHGRVLATAREIAD